MHAFQLSRPVFAAEELRRAINTMAERGIRLRATHSLEDYLADTGHGSGASEDDDWGEAEIEHRASELARLKPY